ncbi:Lrp/AsnC family transcriptional regulator [Paenibacillus alvei]|uniref:Lrp/AsnC family transcriptional regulator n=1 Tax=Paenibacillus alvei TaxID=44250 RepID=A0ABT4GYU1_PAEAL|nr:MULTISPECIES: Lrp/AsnC family transcriptional regulator [Paenibacillus]MCY7482799.1 Lrp/AsnC family transcriptional regulator [Paenibacillus alvei]MCY9761891.1 Lrp/AsnC family transcriptional regulator [Paenibacillus alvei]MCY9769933.1 Lrp/AsnC family transcriptional regulator [Paenibacillus alvei]
MDTIDRSILNALKENGRTTASEISKRVNLSIPAVTERIRKLEEANIIEAYTIKISREKMGCNLLSFIFVTIDQSKHIEDFRKAIVACKSVLECHHVAGQYDYLLKVIVADTQELEHFISHTLKNMIGVHSSNTIISLSSLKENINL